MFRLVVIVTVFFTTFWGRFDLNAEERDSLISELKKDTGVEGSRLSTSGYEDLIGRRIESFDYNLNVGQGRNRFMYNDFSAKQDKTYHLNLSSGIGPVMKWKDGMSTINRLSEDFPGMMCKEAASINVYQNAGRFMFGAHADAMRYGYFHGVSNQYGGGGSVGVKLSDNVSLIVFGSVYSQVRGRGINPAMMGFMPSSGFGGMVDWGFGSFGIMAGMRRDYVPMHGRWEMRPIFAPYFGSGSRKFSIDLGSIFGGFISDMLESKASEISKPRPSNRSMPSVGSPGFVPPHRR